MLSSKSPKKVLLGALMIFNTIFSFAQGGQNDPSFNNSDTGFGYGDFANSDVYSSCLQTDGKIIVAGLFTTFSGVNAKGVVRLNPDATIDPSFNTGTGPNNGVTAVAIQTDGKIIIGGGFTLVNGTFINNIARLNSDGSIDPTFNPGTGAYGISSLAIQSDGKIIVGGSFTSINGTARNRIARLNADGSVDPGFNPGTGANSTVNKISIQQDGKILITGTFSTINGTYQNSLSRLNTDGTIDGTFVQGTGVANGTIESARQQADGKIIITGSFTFYNSTAINKIARLNTDGSIDGAFNSVMTSTDYLQEICIQSDQKIIICGYGSGTPSVFRQYIKRLNPDGSLDATFDAGQPLNSRILTVLQQTNGKIFIGGMFTSVNHSGNNHMSILNADGSIDQTIPAGSGANNKVLASAVQSDGKILVAGMFTGINGNGRNYLGRLNSDGTLDTTFNPLGIDALVFCVGTQPDGKILIGGDFTYVNGQPVNYFARLNADGSTDTSFNIGVGPNIDVYSVFCQADGKILIGGDFTNINGVASSHLARLNQDGSIDVGFLIGSGVNNAVRFITQQPDGKILIGGDFTSINGTTANRIARLNIDGTLDNTFNSTVGITNFSVYSMSVQQDGKIVVGGSFTEIQGSYRYHIARIHPDGSIDDDFSTTGETDNTVYSTSIQPDGKIIIGGDFTTINGISTNYIARLNTDGTPDQNFSAAGGANNTVSATNMLSDGNLFIAGDFTSYNGVGRNRMAKLSICYATTDTVYATEYDSSTFNGQTYTTSGLYTQVLVNAQGCDSILVMYINIINPEIQVFTLPSSADSCTGSAILSMNGFAPFVFSVDGNSFTENLEHTFTGLCPGVYNATVTDSQSTVFNSTFVIAADSSYYEEDPFSDNDTIIDSLSTTIENCEIDYNTITDIYIDSYNEIGQDSLLITWAVVDAFDTTLIETVFYFGDGDGNYYIQLDLFCQGKSMPHYLVATQGIVYSNGTISTVGILENEPDNFALYPNPTNNEVTISFDGNATSLTIYDAQGKLIKQSGIQSGGTVSLKDVQTGVYFFELVTEKGSVVKRVVKN